MGLFDKLKGELIDIVQWLDDSRDTIVWRFPRYENEIKMGARLVVRESQVAVFVNEGQVADVFTPGTYTLETNNLPILSTLYGWKHGFHSPFKAEVYFVTTRLFTDLKWGTVNPVIVRDTELGMVRLRAFGAYALQVTDAKALLGQLAGTDPQFRTEEVGEYLRQTIVGRIGSALATAQVPLLDLAAHQQGIGDRLAQALTTELAELGIAIPRFVIENISVPPEVEAALDKRTQIGLVGDLDTFTRFQTATAIDHAAQNVGGGAGEGIGLGLGLAVGQQMAATLARPAGVPVATPPLTPPSLPAAAQWYFAVGSERQGPADDAAMAAAAASGTLRAETLVWHAGLPAWTPASQVPALAAVLGSVPPPLPPAPPTAAP
ncbi:SPFH domain-containing protein [Xylanimonas sp. McL0601]|uniref:SPFH domain-containing protein n=1 Tax=Xylanimonas sp. McL0601 TaxID=3414739 RepID=UPI003CFA3086